MPSFASAAEPPGRGTLALLAVLAVTAVAIAFVAPRLRAAPPAVALVPPGDPAVTLDREIAAEFGMENPVVWVIAAREGTIWTPAMLERVRALTQEVVTIRGVIATDVVSLASPNLRDLRVTEDGLEPVYLMGEVPRTAEAVDTLRRRVESDPSFRGNLTSLDGRAAVVVANFLADADASAVGRAALALRDRFRDAATDVWVAGGPALRVAAAGAGRSIGPAAAAAGAVGLLALAVLLGARAVAAAASAAVLAVCWTALAAWATGSLMLPWSAYALVPGPLVAVATAVGGTAWTLGPLAAGLAIGFLALGHLAGAPATAFGTTGALGALAAAGAGSLANRAFAPIAPAAGPARPRVRWAAGLLVVVALAGLPRLGVALDLFGYGLRYLPPPASDDLAALARFFPPPTALALRVRTRPGLVSQPAVLQAFDAITTAARADEAVASAMSLADIVKLVNRAFNENRDEYAVIPEDPGLAARYVALAYSPGFRRFVDRALGRAAIWVHLRTADPRALRRVLDRVATQRAATPVPDAEVDATGGDGAVVLVMAREAARLACGFVALLVAVALGGWAVGGRTALGAALAGGLVATSVVAGLLGWAGLAIDLVSLPCAIGAGAAGAALAAGATRARGATLARLGLALAAAAAASFVAPFGALHLVGAVLCGPAAALALVPGAHEETAS